MDRGARGVALDLIQDAGRPGVRLDERLRGCEARKSLDAKDRAFVRELAYGTLRWRGQLDQALSFCLSGSAEKLPPVVLNVLRLGAYQILFTDRIPPWAAVDEAVGQVRARGFAGLAALVNGVLRRLAREAEGWRRTDDAASPQDADALADAESHPRWMVRRWARRWGMEGAVRVCRANNAAGPLTLRVNRRRATPEVLEEALRSAGAEVARGRISPDVLTLRGGGDVRTLPGFRDGWFAVQDEGAALMAPLLGVRPGDRVWDVCAGPGGKTAHLAELMEDEGLLLATDPHRTRLARVAETARRMGLRSVSPVRGGMDASRGEAFDAVLVDAPCSGLGVLRRHPEAKWNKTEADILRLSGLALKILRAASRAVGPGKGEGEGGRLLYCVCSLEEEETGRVVEAFEQSAEGARFQREDLSSRLPDGLSSARRFVDRSGCFALRPGDAGTDGFFAAGWRRISPEERRSG